MMSTFFDLQIGIEGGITMTTETNVAGGRTVHLDNRSRLRTTVPARTLSVLLGLAVLSGPLIADSTYRDPNGRFAITVPTGWTQTSGEGFFKLDRGAASVIVLAIDESQSPKAAVATILQEIGREWRSFNQQDSAEVRFGGQPGFSAGGFGVNASGQQAFVMVSAAGTRGVAYAMVASALTAEIQSINPDLQKIIEGFAIRTVSPEGRTVSPEGQTVSPEGRSSPQQTRLQTARNLTFNGRTLTADQLARLEKLERPYQARIPDGKYWYDNRTGAAGFWGAPAVALLAAGLELGGPMPANCSGGGTGRFTGVFINGRELHPLDVAFLSSISPNGQVLPGRFWVNANGDFGYEGGQLIYNLYRLAEEKRISQQRNANGGAARNAMDGISVGPGYFLDRGTGSSATKY
jgi:hypothetical protein